MEEWRRHVKALSESLETNATAKATGTGRACGTGNQKKKAKNNKRVEEEDEEEEKDDDDDRVSGHLAMVNSHWPTGLTC